MQIKQLLTISILLGICIWSCHTKPYNKQHSSNSKKQSDTLYFGYKYMEKMAKEYQPMNYTQAAPYLSRVHNLLVNRITSFDTISYKKIYASDTFFLGNETWGKLVYFENETIQWYNSVQLYLLNEKGKTKDILETIAIFGDAGRILDCHSFLIQEKDISTIYTRIYDSYITSDYINGAWHDIDYVQDTIIAYQLKNGRKYPFKISTEKQKELKQLFIENVRN